MKNIPVSFPLSEHTVWNATVNYIDSAIQSGHSLPWSPGPTSAVCTPYGEIPAGIGLFDSRGCLTMYCNDQASAEVWARWINDEFEEG